MTEKSLNTLTETHRNRNTQKKSFNDFFSKGFKRKLQGDLLKVVKNTTVESSNLTKNNGKNVKLIVLFSSDD